VRVTPAKAQKGKKQAIPENRLLTKSKVMTIAKPQVKIPSTPMIPRLSKKRPQTLIADYLPCKHIQLICDDGSVYQHQSQYETCC
jgi:hypothetical protein